MKKAAIYFAALLIIALQAKAAAANALTGTAGAAFLKLNGGVRAAAMGEAFTAVADGPGAIYYNPAGIVQADSFELSSQYSSWLAGISRANLSFIAPRGQLAIGVSYDYINIGQIQETTLSNPNGTGRMFDPADHCLSIALATKANSRFSFGVAAKAMSESIDTANSSGFAADAGVLFKINDRLSAGLSAKNIIGSLGNKEIARNIGGGFAFRSGHLLLAADVNIPSDNTMYYSVGGELEIGEMLWLRAGYNTRAEESAGGNLGAGIGIKLGGMMFDYAYVPYGDIGDTHRFSLSMELGKGSAEAAQTTAENIAEKAVQEEIAEIRVFPEQIDIKAGETAVFTSKFYGTGGREVKAKAFWRVTGKIGSVSPESGIFTASGKGTGLVTAYPLTKEITDAASVESGRKRLEKILSSRVSASAKVKVIAKPKAKKK